MDIKSVMAHLIVSKRKDMFKYNFADFVRVWSLVNRTEGEKGAEHNIWTEEGRSNRSLKKTA